MQRKELDIPQLPLEKTCIDADDHHDDGHHNINSRGWKTVYQPLTQLQQLHAEQRAGNETSLHKRQDGLRQRKFLSMWGTKGGVG